jgi:hypothetical protein
MNSVFFFFFFFFFFFIDGLGPVACSHAELILKLWIFLALGRTPWTGISQFGFLKLISKNLSEETQESHEDFRQDIQPRNDLFIYNLFNDDYSGSDYIR